MLQQPAIQTRFFLGGGAESEGLTVGSGGKENQVVIEVLLILGNLEGLPGSSVAKLEALGCKEREGRMGVGKIEKPGQAGQKKGFSQVRRSKKAWCDLLRAADSRTT